MSLVRDVAAKLDEENVDFALIGATALAVHGVSRATADVDFFTVDSKVLRREMWSDVETSSTSLRIIKGDFEDPLAGSVRFTDEGDRIVDIVVGRYEWQEEVVQRATRVSIGEVEVKVVRPADLVLLKLFAGGPQDAWDIHSLLANHPEKAAIAEEVERGVSVLPDDSGALWVRIRDELE